jgi:Fe-Mn family superoxide dismutase
MSSVPNRLADTRIPAVPLTKVNFDLSGVRGLSTRALELHLSLYEGYVKEANDLLAQLDEFPKAAALSASERLIRDGLVRRLAFEHNGVLWHESFFESLGAAGGQPAANSVFAEALDESFGGFAAWKRDVIELGQTRGVGWVITFHSRSDNRLLNAWVADHTGGILADLKPVAVFDLWEHAFMLDFKPSQRADYLNVLFENLNWGVIETRCV